MSGQQLPKGKKSNNQKKKKKNHALYEKLLTGFKVKVMGLFCLLDD